MCEGWLCPKWDDLVLTVVITWLLTPNMWEYLLQALTIIVNLNSLYSCNSAYSCNSYNYKDPLLGLQANFRRNLGLMFVTDCIQKYQKDFLLMSIKQTLFNDHAYSDKNVIISNNIIFGFT